MLHVTAHHLPGFFIPKQCLQASLQTLSLPAYAPDLRAGAALLPVLTVMHQWSPHTEGCCGLLVCVHLSAYYIQPTPGLRHRHAEQ